MGTRRLPHAALLLAGGRRTPFGGAKLRRGGVSVQDRGLPLRRDVSRRSTPLAGLQAGLAAARSEACFVAGADMPFAADRKLLRALDAAPAGHDAAAPRSAGHAAAPPGSPGVEQPLCPLVRRQPCLKAANALLARRPAGPFALLQAV